MASAPPPSHRGAEDGEIDLGAVLELIDHLCKAGIRGILMFGAAGEYPSFSADERARVLYLAVKRSRAPILAGVGSASFDASSGSPGEARDAGAAGLLLPPPFFFRYGQDEIREFYLQFAAEAGKGARIFISNDPEGCSPIAPETAKDLLQTGLFTRDSPTPATCRTLMPRCRGRWLSSFSANPTKRSLRTGAPAQV